MQKIFRPIRRKKASGEPEHPRPGGNEDAESVHGPRTVSPDWLVFAPGVLRSFLFFSRESTEPGLGSPKRHAHLLMTAGWREAAECYWELMSPVMCTMTLRTANSIPKKMARLIHARSECE